MADIFLPPDLTSFLADKHVVFLGGSVVRGLYRDMVWLINSASLIPYEVLGSKGDEHFPELEKTVWRSGQVSEEVAETFKKGNRDTLLEYKGLTSGRTYIEPRRYHNKEHNITLVYRFISRVWSDELSDWLSSYQDVFGGQIDILLINSCLWDVNRWGPTGPQEFKTNLSSLISAVPNILSTSGQAVWLTSPPGAREIDSKGMNVPGLDFQCLTTRYNVVEANWVSALLAGGGGMSVLDIHYYLQAQTARRNKDGIHWSSSTNRLITNLILTQLVLLTHGPAGLPGRVTGNYSLELAKLRAEVARKNCSKEYVEERLTVLDKLLVKTNAGNMMQIDKKTLEHREKVTRKLLDIQGVMEGRSKMEEFRSRISVRRGQKRCHPDQNSRIPHVTNMPQNYEDVDNHCHSNVQEESNDTQTSYATPPPPTCPYPGYFPHQQQGVGTDVSPGVQRRMLVREMYRVRVMQARAMGMMLTPQNKYQIRLEVERNIDTDSDIMNRNFKGHNSNFRNVGIGIESVQEVNCRGQGMVDSFQGICGMSGWGQTMSGAGDELTGWGPRMSENGHVQGMNMQFSDQGLPEGGLGMGRGWQEVDGFIQGMEGQWNETGHGGWDQGMGGSGGNYTSFGLNGTQY